MNDMEVAGLKRKTAKLISVITVVPIVALFAITLLYVEFKEQFRSIWWYIYSIFFLTLLPISSYPLQYVLPKYKNAGRSGERKLAFILAVIGYLVGIILSFLLKAPTIVQKIFSAYVTSGVLLAIINKFIKFKASGHACGISGPITLLYYFLGKSVLWLCLILPIVYWARISLDRHSIKELIAGTGVGILSTITALCFFQLF